jgi:hypothetical protein
MPQTQVGHIARFRVTITVAVVVALLAGALIVAFLFFPAYGEQLKFAAAVFGGSAAVYAAYYVGAALREQLIRGKRKNAFDMLQSLNCIDMAKVRILIKKEISNKHLSPHDLYERIMGEPELLSAVSTLLGFLEDISIAIQYDYVDEEVMFFSLEYLAPWFYFGLRPYIEEKRRVDNNACLFVELQKVVHVWQESKSLVNGRHFRVTSSSRAGR